MAYHLDECNSNKAIGAHQTSNCMPSSRQQRCAECQYKLSTVSFSGAG